MRVLQLTPDLGNGGAERLLADLSVELTRRGIHLKIGSLFPETGSVVERRLRESSADVAFMGKRKGLDLRMPAAILAEVRRFRPDVIHTHRAVLKYLLPVLAWYRGAVVHTIHNVAKREVPAPDRVLQRVLFRSRRVLPVAVGEMVARSVWETYRVQPRIIVNGVAHSRAPKGTVRCDPHVEFGIGANKVVASVLGRLQPQKNVAAVIRAASATRDLPLHFLVIGDGAERPDLARMARNMGVADRVTFTGIREDVPDLLSASDLVISTSRWEWLPLALIEAQTAGLPVVAYDVGGVREVVLDGRTGILRPVDDEPGIEEALRLLANNRVLRNQMGEAAVVHSESKFAFSRCVDHYLEVYRGEVTRLGPLRSASLS